MKHKFSVSQPEVRVYVEVRDKDNIVVGRGHLYRTGTGVNVIMKQVRGGTVDGTLDRPLEADIEVLRAFVDAADGLT